MSSLSSNWSYNKVKYIASYINGYPFKPSDWNDKGIKIIRIQNLSNPDSQYNYYDGELEEKYMVKKGDILISWSGTLGVYLWDQERALLNQHIFKVIPDESKVNKDFYFFLAIWFLQEIKKDVHGSTMKHITKDKFGSFKFRLPSLKEQEKIADYLSVKKSKVEKLIQTKKALIDLLKVEKKILISNYVTGKMSNHKTDKKCQLSWIKSIPNTWNETRAKNIFYEIDKRSENGSEQLLSVSHYTGVTPRSEKKVTMIMAESYEGYKLCRKDDLVINIMWAWMGALGISRYNGIVSNGYGVYRLKSPDKFNSKFLDYLLRTDGYIGEYIIRSKGVHSSRWRMYSDEFFDIPIIYPPIVEQDKIVSKVDKEVEKIDAAIIKAEKEIVLINEYYNVLISEVIIGNKSI